ncbi:MAG TPA: amidohydrolase family protein [Rhodothermales bacterium]|nr:amidohydrolase family protein [Rhodothermales bacterium]
MLTRKFKTLPVLIPIFLLPPSVLPPSSVHAQEMTIEEYEPRSTLVVPANIVTQARYPFVDVHAHQRSPSTGQVDTLVQEMDAMNMAVMVNLSGGTGESLVRTVETMKGAYPSRFVVFSNIDFSTFTEPNFGDRAAAQVERDVANGAQGLKIFKNLGMFLRDADGAIVAADDPRLDPIWQKCADLGIPVLIHVGEPSPFFETQDRYNERWLELKEFPERKRPPDEFGTWEEVMGRQHNLFRRHPRTTFINSHLGWLGNDLGRLGALMDELPNMYTEIGAVLAELGRQPRFAREWLIRRQDRVLFGKDAWSPEEYHVYFRTLETADEYFEYYRKRHAHWRIYGLDLPDEVLRKLYYENALRIIPGLDQSLFSEE